MSQTLMDALATKQISEDLIYEVIGDQGDNALKDSESKEKDNRQQQEQFKVMIEYLQEKSREHLVSLDYSKVIQEQSWKRKEKKDKIEAQEEKVLQEKRRKRQEIRQMKREQEQQIFDSKPMFAFFQQLEQQIQQQDEDDRSQKSNSPVSSHRKKRKNRKRQQQSDDEEEQKEQKLAYDSYDDGSQTNNSDQQLVTQGEDHDDDLNYRISQTLQDAQQHLDDLDLLASVEKTKDMLGDLSQVEESDYYQEIVEPARKKRKKELDQLMIIETGQDQVLIEQVDKFAESTPLNPSDYSQPSSRSDNYKQKTSKSPTRRQSQRSQEDGTNSEMTEQSRRSWNNTFGGSYKQQIQSRDAKLEDVQSFRDQQLSRGSKKSSEKNDDKSQEGGERKFFGFSVDNLPFQSYFASSDKTKEEELKFQNAKNEKNKIGSDSPKFKTQHTVQKTLIESSIESETITSSDRNYKRNSKELQDVNFTNKEFENFKSDMMYQQAEMQEQYQAELDLQKAEIFAQIRDNEQQQAEILQTQEDLVYSMLARLESVETKFLESQQDQRDEQVVARLKTLEVKLLEHQQDQLDQNQPEDEQLLIRLDQLEEKFFQNQQDQLDQNQPDDELLIRLDQLEEKFFKNQQDQQEKQKQHSSQISLPKGMTIQKKFESIENLVKKLQNDSFTKIEQIKLDQAMIGYSSAKKSDSVSKPLLKVQGTATALGPKDEDLREAEQLIFERISGLYTRFDHMYQEQSKLNEAQAEKNLELEVQIAQQPIEERQQQQYGRYSDQMDDSFNEGVSLMPLMNKIAHMESMVRDMKRDQIQKNMHQEKQTRDVERKSDMVRRDLTMVQSLQFDESEEKPEIQLRLEWLEDSIIDLKEKNEDKLNNLAEQIKNNDKGSKFQLSAQSVTVDYILESIQNISNQKVQFAAAQDDKLPFSEQSSVRSSYNRQTYDKKFPRVTGKSWNGNRGSFLSNKVFDESKQASQVVVAQKTHQNYVKKPQMSDIDEPSQSERDDDIGTLQKSQSSEYIKEELRQSNIIQSQKNKEADYRSREFMLGSLNQHVLMGKKEKAIPARSSLNEILKKKNDINLDRSNVPYKLFEETKNTQPFSPKMEQQNTIVDKAQRENVRSSDIIQADLNRGNILGEGLLLSEKSQTYDRSSVSQLSKKLEPTELQMQQEDVQNLFQQEPYTFGSNNYRSDTANTQISPVKTIQKDRLEQNAPFQLAKGTLAQKVLIDNYEDERLSQSQSNFQTGQTFRKMSETPRNQMNSQRLDTTPGNPNMRYQQTESIITEDDEIPDKRLTYESSTDNDQPLSSEHKRQQLQRKDISDDVPDMSVTASELTTPMPGGRNTYDQQQPQFGVSNSVPKNLDLFEYTQSLMNNNNDETPGQNSQPKLNRINHDDEIELKNRMETTSERYTQTRFNRKDMDDSIEVTIRNDDSSEENTRFEVTKSKAVSPNKSSSNMSKQNFY